MGGSADCCLNGLTQTLLELLTPIVRPDIPLHDLATTGAIVLAETAMGIRLTVGVIDL